MMLMSENLTKKITAEMINYFEMLMTQSMNHKVLYWNSSECNSCPIQYVIKQ